MPASLASGGGQPKQRGNFKAQDKPDEVRRSNLNAAKAVADAIRTSLGPKGMDKMIQTPTGEVVITNDGATILKHMAVMHPAARMLVELSQAQDVEAGDGTTSVVVVAGSLLGAAEKMLNKGIHPTIIAESFTRAAAKAVQYLEEISTPVDLKDKESLLRAASTSLNSKVRCEMRDKLHFSFRCTQLFIRPPYLCTDRLTILFCPGSHCCRSSD